MRRQQIRVRSENRKTQTGRLMGCSALLAFVIPLGSLLTGRALAPAMVVVFSGCSVLSPKPDRARFILLAATTPGGSNNGRLAANPNLPSLVIGLGPVQLPDYLDRPELVIRTSPNGFDLSETDRWAESLADNFRRVLANDLTELMGTANIVQYPWYAGTRLDYIAHVQVQRFEADTNHNAQLIAHWDLRTSRNDQLLVSREAQLSRPVTSLSGEAAAAALSADVAELAGLIASGIAQVQQQRLARGPS